MSLQCRCQPRASVFTYGVLPLAAAGRLRIQQLHDLATLTTSATPRRRSLNKTTETISFAQWYQWAAQSTTLSLSRALAWKYFETFKLVTLPPPISLPQHYRDLNDNAHQDTAAVELCAFLIFLFIQVWQQKVQNTVQILLPLSAIRHSSCT